MSPKTDFSQFYKLAGNIESASKDKQVEEIIVKMLFELANTTLALTKEKTPEGQYNNQVSFTTKDGVKVDFTTKSNRQGGHLRREWFISGVERSGDTLTIEIYNNVDYASFVENGHRTTNGGWVEGRFMLKVSIKEVEQILPEIVERHQKQFLKELVTV